MKFPRVHGRARQACLGIVLALPTVVLPLRTSSAQALGAASPAQISRYAGQGIGDGQPATQAPTGGIYALAVAPNGDIYFSGSQDRVRVINRASGLLSTVAGNGSYLRRTNLQGVPALQDSVYCNGGSKQYKIGECLRVGPDGAVYLSVDAYAIYRVDPVSGLINIFAGKPADGSPGTGVDFGAPIMSFAFSSTGDLIVATMTQVFRVSRATGTATVIAGAPTGGSTADGISATGANLTVIESMVLDSSDNIFLSISTSPGAGQGFVRRIDGHTGIIATVMGTSPAAPTVTPVVGSVGSSDSVGAAHLTMDTRGNLVVDAQAQGVFVLNTAGDTISSVVAPGVLQGRVLAVDAQGGWLVVGNELDRFDPVSQTSVRIAGVPESDSVGGADARDYDLESSLGFAVDATGAVFVAQALPTRALVTRIAPQAGAVSTFYRYTGNAGAQALVVTRAGVITADLNEVNLTPFNSADPTVSSSPRQFLVGTGTAGFGGDGGPGALALVNNPTGLASDGQILYISDTGNNRIRALSLVDGTIRTLAGDGAPHYVADGVPATQGGLSGPEGLALDGHGHLFVADTGNNRVRRVDLTSGIITTVAGTGVPERTNDGHPAVTAALNAPETVAVSGTSLYIADTGNYVVRRVDLNSGLIERYAGTGSPGSGGDNGPALDATMRPDDVAVLPDGRLLIGDRGANAIRVVTAATPGDSAAPPRPPTAPTGVRATARLGAASLVWQASSDTGSSPITDYLVTMYPEGTVTHSTTTSVTVHPVHVNRRHWFTVQAVNGAGGSPSSLASNAVTYYTQGLFTVSASSKRPRRSHASAFRAVVTPAEPGHIVTVQAHEHGKWVVIARLREAQGGRIYGRVSWPRAMTAWRLTNPATASHAVFTSGTHAL